MKHAKKLAPIAMLGVLALVLSACSSSSTSSSASPTASGLDGRGPITYVQGKDNSNVVKPLVAKWNAAHPTEKVTFKEQTDQADQQHDDLVQNFQTKNPNYDVMSVDVIWTAEFAAKGWLQPLAAKQAIDTSKMLPATVKAATYRDVLYAAPVSTDGGILFYRKDCRGHQLGRRHHRRR
jgi:multiple sugar transport system substrate-binding protein